MTAASAPAQRPAVAWGGERLGKRIGRNLLRALPIRLFGRLFPRRVVGLCYHVVSGAELPHVRNLFAYKTPEQFESDLLFLKRHYRILCYEELERGEVREPNGVIVSFDDGMAECYTVARPLLLKHGVPCVFFVSPAHLDNQRMFPFDRASLCIEAVRAMPAARQAQALGTLGAQLDREFGDLTGFAAWITTWIRTLDRAGERQLDEICARLGVQPERYLAERQPYMTREQVRGLAADGFTVGGHGSRHVALGAFSAEEIAEEVVESCRQVSELTGAQRVPFAFPYDADGVDRGLLESLRARHPFLGLFFDTRQLREDREFMVNRMIVDLPPAAFPERSNLPGYFRSAYYDELMRLAGLPDGIGAR